MKTTIIFIVNGVDDRVDGESDMMLGFLRDYALTETNNTGRPMVEWEIHNTDGQNLDPNKTVAENGLVDGSRVFLNLKVGAGGEGQHGREEVKRVIPACRHEFFRMVEWAKEGACPICLTAANGILNDEIKRVAREERVKCISEIEAYAKRYAEGGVNEMDRKSEAWMISQAAAELRKGLDA
jgi:hypothetical protein